MSEIVSRIFNRSTYTLLAALSVPVLFYVFWNYANNQANMMVKETSGAIKKNVNQDKISVDDYNLKEVNDSNEVKWLLAAKTGVIDPVTKDVNLDTVHVDYFDGATLKMRISSPIGLANENTHMVKLFAQGGKRVEAQGEGGKAKLDAQKIELMEKNQFLASGGVNIIWPGVAKVTGNEATGSLKSTDLKNLTIKGNTHAAIGGNQ